MANARLTEYRHRHGLTQEQCAELMGVSPAALRRWERDGVTPGIAKMEAVCMQIGEPPASLGWTLQRTRRSAQERERRAWTTEQSKKQRKAIGDLLYVIGERQRRGLLPIISQGGAQ